MNADSFWAKFRLFIFVVCNPCLFFSFFFFFFFHVCCDSVMVMVNAPHWWSKHPLPTVGSGFLSTVWFICLFIFFSLFIYLFIFLIQVSECPAGQRVLPSPYRSHGVLTKTDCREHAALIESPTCYWHVQQPFSRGQSGAWHANPHPCWTANGC